MKKHKQLDTMTSSKVRNYFYNSFIVHLHISSSVWGDPYHVLNTLQSEFFQHQLIHLIKRQLQMVDYE